jgi:hypothetical protein
MFVLNNCSSIIKDIGGAPIDVKEYLHRTFDSLLTLDVFEEALAAVLDYGEHPGTVKKIVSLIKNIVALN